jgi:hypothetical protein
MVQKNYVSLRPLNGLETIRSIHCGTTTPKASGSMDITSFAALTSFTCTNNDIQHFQGFDNKHLQVLSLELNKLQDLNIESVSRSLGTIRLNNNPLTDAAIENIVEVLVDAGRTSTDGTCELHLPDNIIPTQEAQDNINILVSRGWSVIFTPTPTPTP